ncbi:MAG: 23S rRNA (adenine(2503)-C(2))-methyltransferase RlmN [Polyangiaceae bacterium]|nr:23S rRNA (adenine(2503)-C(2))-methyltransferase RlmN [Polyangiaceae bacterium]
MEPAKIALQGCTPDALVGAFPDLAPGEARRVHSHVMKGRKLSDTIVQVRRGPLESVRTRGEIPSLEVVTHEKSKLDPFEKWMLRTPDGEVIETVRIPLEKEGRFSVCVSTQVGCAMACTFCATGRLGLRRNLEVWEIVEQVRIVRASLPEGSRIHGVVFQGMGEPLANYERVVQAIRVFSQSSGLAIDGRNVTVCTSGNPGAIRKLAEDAPNARLGISIASALSESRKKLMPVENVFALRDVLDAAAFHAEKTAMSPMFALTLLAGVNDSEDDARAFAGLFQAFYAATGRRPRVSIIPYNSIGANDPYMRTSDEREEAFRAILLSQGVPTHKRYSGGGDVSAACGQLAALGATGNVGKFRSPKSTIGEIR